MKGLQRIKQGIAKGNWEYVVQGYSDMTGEELAIPAAVTTNTITLKPEDIQVVLNRISKELTQAFGVAEVPVDTPEETPEVAPKTSKKKASKKKVASQRKTPLTKVEAITKVLTNDVNKPAPSVNTSASIVAKGRGEIRGDKMIMPFASEVDEELVEANQILHSSKNKREPYTPRMMRCQCGNEFDYNKEYPAIPYESNQLKLLCPRCLSKS